VLVISPPLLNNKLLGTCDVIVNSVISLLDRAEWDNATKIMAL